MASMSDKMAPRLFLVSTLLLVFGYGMLAGKYELFPYHVFSLAADEFELIRMKTGITDRLPFGYARPTDSSRPALMKTDEASKGVNLVIHFRKGQRPTAKIMDLDGKTLHLWDIDWFKIWPDAKHVPNRRKPRARPGTHIHGAVVMPNGDLVFNFDHLGLVRLDPQGEVIWRLPYQTHHSVHLHDDGNLWVSGQKEHKQITDKFPNRQPPFEEYTILEVSPEGKILHEWSVADILRKNGLNGLLYMGTIANESTQVRGDVLHLNDVEPFPNTLEEGFFKKGDVLVSLRNINTIFVFDQKTEKIKFISTGQVIRQHDPDFVDGNTISVFDNNSTAPEDKGPQSRIVTLSAPDGKLKVVYEGTRENPFFTNIMGKHQWLPNGNLLITESSGGRAFEINPSGEIVWQYTNYFDDNTVGVVEQVERYPDDYRQFYLDSKPNQSETRPDKVVKNNSDNKK